jgi:hypothetical protein
MTQISGKCLCGNISYSSDTEIKMMANCHCSDCRSVTGAAYGTLVFVEADAVEIRGEPKIFKHTSDSGAAMQKLFCGDCGSQLFGKNSNRPSMLSIRAGGLDDNSFVKPTVNVYLSSKLESTPIDSGLRGFEKMPG